MRDACLVHHAWLNELTVFGDKSLRSQLDDAVHVLTRTQQVVSLAGNVFTGGIAEAVFGGQLQMILDEKSRIGSPAAGACTDFAFVLVRCLKCRIDAPPSRVSNLIKYAEWLLKPEQNNGTWVADVLWPVINLDLQWIASRWNESS